MVLLNKAEQNASQLHIIETFNGSRQLTLESDWSLQSLADLIDLFICNWIIVPGRDRKMVVKREHSEEIQYLPPVCHGLNPLLFFQCRKRLPRHLQSSPKCRPVSQTSQCRQSSASSRSYLKTTFWRTQGKEISLKCRKVVLMFVFLSHVVGVFGTVVVRCCSY